MSILTLRFFALAWDLEQMTSCFSMRSGAKLRPQILQLARPGTGLGWRGACWEGAAAVVYKISQLRIPWDTTQIETKEPL
ncbi:hypothetical protein E2C01_020412 [Portunus trituberculatus]|uniref:Secreted protein n=1 Tax=Portunus trituberculatus TaxID=210409 RepID=A0A5B7E1Y8_PORTR|nr:hypothetical protein [Portunus trituberculatus]